MSLVHSSVAVLLLHILIGNNYVCSQFITTCNGVDGLTGAQLCTGFCAAGASSATCSNPDGICQCNFPCDTPPAPSFSTMFCPAPPTTPALDPAVTQACDDACKDPSICPNADGTGVVCGFNGPINANMDYLAICTCYCPAQPCATTTTTTTRSIALIPNPLPLIKIKKKAIKWKVLGAYILKFSLLFLKLLALTALKVLLFCLYFSLGEEDVSPMENMGWGYLR